MLKFAPKRLQKLGRLIGLMVDKRFHLVRRLPLPLVFMVSFCFLKCVLARCASAFCVVDKEDLCSAKLVFYAN